VVVRSEGAGLRSTVTARSEGEGVEVEGGSATMTNSGAHTA
jgi:hypothetical protein